MAQNLTAGRGRSVARWAAGVVVVLAVGVVAGWAGHEVLMPASGGTASEVSSTYATVAEGEVGSSMSLKVSSSWPSHASGVNKAAGTVTSVEVSAGDHVSAGDELFTVDLRPVVVAKGAVPAFRSLQQGDSGADVRQLQQLLKKLGMYSQSVNGAFDAGVTRAVKIWQSQLGVDADGVVQAGDVLYLSSLPARVTLDAGVVRTGAQLVGGERVVRTLASAPTFVLNVTATQASRIAEGADLQITSPQGDVWTAFAGTQTLLDDGATVSVALSGKDDTSVCGNDCDQLSASGSTALDSTIVTVPKTTGLVVPSAALMTSASGTVQVVDSEGNSLPATVSATANGMSVISGEGIRAGLSVRVPVQ